MRTLQHGFGQNFGLVGKNVRRYMATTALTASSLIAIASPALADNWTDHVADEGSISIDTTTPSTTNITQHTDFVKVHGDGDINAGWTVNVAQPGKTSKYVLYDVENDPTQILGTLNANGRVYIFDKNGVIFGEGAQVNVGSIVASTGYISDANIKSDKLVFEGIEATDGAIINNGTISVGEAGLAAFVAPTVINNGVIAAHMGTVVLAAGEKVAIDMFGDKLVELTVDGALEEALIENKGTITANGGTVMISAQAAKGVVDNVINMDGIIDVSSVSVKGGKIVLSGGNKGVVNVNGTMKADGKDGGDVKITGQNILAAESSLLSANALTAGNGGTVDLIASDSLAFGGLIEAKGGLLSGNGGAVDTSGKDSVDIWGTVDAAAYNGANGTWLIDPSNLRIVSGSSSNVTGNPFSPTGGFLSGVSRIRNTVINAALNTGTDVTITTVGSSNKLLQDGTISIEADITKTFDNTSTLFIQAAGSIISFASSTISAAGDAILNVVMEAADNILLSGDIITAGGDATFTSANGNFTLFNGGLIATGSGDINVNADGTVYTILGVPVTGTLATYGVLDAGGGNINLHQSAVFDGDVDSIRTSGAGTITMNQNKVNIYGSIQDAIDAVQNTGTGTNTINVGAGTYYESVEIYENNFVLNGANAGTAGFDPRGAESIIDPNSPGFYVTGDNAVIDGFTITATSNPNGDGVFVDGADNVQVINNVIYDIARNGILFKGGMGGYAAGNKINDTGEHGIFVRDTYDFTVEENEIGMDGGNIHGNGVFVRNSHDGVVRANAIGNTVLDAFPDDASGVYVKDSHDVMVGGENEEDGNIIRNVDWDGVKVAGGYDNIVQNNDILTTARVGVWGYFTQNLKVLDNTVQDTNVTAGIGIEGGSDVLIKGNEVYQTKGGLGGATNLGDGISVRNTAGDITIINNIVGDSGNLTKIVGNGIALYNIEGAFVAWNKIYNTATHIWDHASGVYVKNGTGNNIFANFIRNVDWDGVKIDGGADNAVSWNNIAHATRVGIWAVDTDNVGIYSNTVFDTHIDAGIGVLRGTDATISFNNVKKTTATTNANRGDGISVRDTDGEVIITANTVGDITDATKIMGNGIALYNIDGAFVALNKIYNTATHIWDRASGVYVKNGNGNNIFANFIRGADWDGIKIYGGSENNVSWNNIADSYRVGIWAEDTDNVGIYNNTVVDSNVTAGIGVYGGNGAIISYNTVKDTSGSNKAGSRGDGISVRDTAGDVIVTHNLVGDVTNATKIIGNGIALYGIEGGLVGWNSVFNTQSDSFDGTHGSGVYIEGGNSNRVIGNFIRGANWDGIKLNYGADHYVGWNNIARSTRVGIWAVNVEDAEIAYNYVNDSNKTAGIGTEDSTNAYIHHNIVLDSVGDGILARDMNGTVRIMNNYVKDSSDDGIEVSDSSAYVYISGNTVRDSGFGGADSYGGDGIFVYNVSPGVSPMVWGSDVGGGAYNVVVYDNDVDNSADDGIQVGTEESLILFKALLVPDPTPDGVLVQDNIVTNSGANGLFISGPDHTMVNVNGNTFDTFDIGANFESGTIDLTGASNTFRNGRVGLRFAPYSFGEGFPFAFLELVDDDAPGVSPYVPGVAPTNFGGTIGAQIFENIDEYYVELDNEAFFAPGFPTWLNGLNSSYDGFIPATDPDGILDDATYDALEAKFFHYIDRNDLGLFFFGLRETPLINQNLIFNRFAAFNGDLTGLNVTITGLPSTGPGGAPQNFNNINTFAGGPTDPNALNNINTAAGGNAGSTNNPVNLNAINTQSGDNNESCWSNAAASAGNGQVVNVVYGGSLSDNLTQAAACGGGF